MPAALPRRQGKMRGYFVASAPALANLAVLDRGRAGDADGSDNLAIRDEGNAAFERRGSAQRERAQSEAALRYQVLDSKCGRHR